MSLEVYLLPVLTDNYIFIARNEKENLTACVDPAESRAVEVFLDQKKWSLTHILNTHHHWDHVGGNLELKKRYHCQIIGAKVDQNRIPGTDLVLEEGDSFFLGEEEAKVLFVPGHTSGHIAFWFQKAQVLFCGDTLFSMGCGRLFEGTPEQMQHSLQKIQNLPDETRIYCTHEYTEKNGRFALSLEPKNAHLQKRMKDVGELRNQGNFTIPTVLGLEKQTNPFLRVNQPEIQNTLGMSGAQEGDIFAEIRRRRDHF